MFHYYNQEPRIHFICNKMTKANTKKCEALIKEFCQLHDIRLLDIIVDMRKTRNRYESPGLFGGFNDMYNKTLGQMYFNPYNFVEFVNPRSPMNIAHLACHELVHVKQIQSRQMWVSFGGNYLVYKGVKHRRAPFKVDLFNKIREKSGKLAEEYHYTALPWEKDAYELAEKFMGRPLWKSYA